MLDFLSSKGGIIVAVCYFDDDYKKRFNCEYEQNEKGIESNS